MKILNSSQNDKSFNPTQKLKKISPLFSTLKSHKIVKPRPIFNEHNKNEVEYLKISGELSLTKQSKSIELCKSETSADLSIKNEDSMKFAPAPKPSPSKLKILKKRNFVQKEGHFNTGRWQQDEHERFIEAILKFGNEWKKVQKYVKTRSSTQARSHAQKFLYKVNKSNLFDLDINLAKNSLKSLHDLESKLEEEKFANAVRILNHIGFEKNSGSKVRLSSRKIKIPNEDFQTPTTKSSLHFGKYIKK